MSDKILFLDIDGVVLPFGMDSIPERVRIDLRLAYSVGWRFILHSGMRGDRLGMAFDLFDLADVDLSGYVSPSIPSKREAIIAWLCHHYGAESDWPECVVVDDDDLGEFPAGVRFVRVNPNECFSARCLADPP